VHEHVGRCNGHVSGAGSTQALREAWVDLDRDDGSGGAREFTSQRAGAGAELEDDLVRSDPGATNEIGSDAAIKEVLPAPGGRRRTVGARPSRDHGRPP
jgi:hypothetical protein